MVAGAAACFFLQPPATASAATINVANFMLPATIRAVHDDSEIISGPKKGEGAAAFPCTQNEHDRSTVRLSIPYAFA